MARGTILVPTPCARALAVLALGASLCACSKASRAPGPVGSAVPEVSRRPIDHLAPDELAPSKSEVYGFAVPLGMAVESRLADRAYVSGRVSREALASYVRDQVVVSHVEVAPTEMVFRMARIKAGAPNRFFNFRVLPDGPRTRLVIEDVTPPPPPLPGLSDAERWRAAGYTPDGRPLDLKKLE